MGEVKKEHPQIKLGIMINVFYIRSEEVVYDLLEICIAVSYDVYGIPIRHSSTDYLRGDILRADEECFCIYTDSHIFNGPTTAPWG